MLKRLTSAAAAIALFLIFGAGTAGAQKLSDRPVTIIAPFTPGTGIDILARVLAEELRRRWDQPFVVENKPGASGNIGTQIASRGAPDGHTLLMTVNSFVINAGYFKNLPYDPIKSFTPIIEVAIGGFMLVVHPKVPAKTASDFVSYAKANPGKMNFASPGLVTPHHVSMEMFKAATGIDIVHVPYSGSAGAVRDLLSGNIETMFLPVHVGLPLVQQGMIRALAVGGAERSALAPDIPTLAEQGISDVEVDLWYALLAPAGTSDDIVQRYNRTINQILDVPSVRELLLKQGLIARGGTPQALSDLIVKDLDRWGKVLSQAGIREK
jgi:tripartite-type tricarboxylate transporter receptor subunit TctC